MTITPELVGFVLNIMAIGAAFLKLESRLTALETTQRLMLDGMVKTKLIDRRQDGE